MTRTAPLYATAALATLALTASYIDTPFAQARPQTPAAPAAPAQTQGRAGRAGDTPAPARKAGEGQGPFKKMVIRSVTLIDGTGGPPLSPMDIVIEGNKITQVRQGGWPGLPQPANREPRDADFEIDGKGMFVMPGFVDMH
ncbi:MAG: amidohydrolase, partial [Acidobacteriota bacterium]